MNWDNSACFNLEGNLPLSMQESKFSDLNLTQVFVQFNDLSGNIFLLARLFNVEITDNLFNFNSASFPEMKG